MPSKGLVSRPSRGTGLSHNGNGNRHMRGKGDLDSVYPSSGRSGFRASRLSVPAGTTRSGIPVWARPSAT